LTVIKEYKQASEIWLNFQNDLEDYILKKTNNKGDTQEINQLVLMKVIESCCSDIKIRNLRSWLFRIAHNVTVDFIKKNNKVHTQVLAVTENSETDPYSSILPFLGSLIGFLPEKYAMPLKMADLQDLKHKEIAERMGLSLSATKSRILRGRILLKEEILSCFEIEGYRDKSFVLKKSCKPLQEISCKKTC